MEKALEQKLSARKNECLYKFIRFYQRENRINNYNKMHGGKINNQLFNKEKNFHQKLIKLPQKVTMKNNLI